MINDIPNIYWVVLICILYHFKQSSEPPDSEFDNVVIWYFCDTKRWQREFDVSQTFFSRFAFMFIYLLLIWHVCISPYYIDDEIALLYNLFRFSCISNVSAQKRQTCVNTKEIKTQIICDTPSSPDSTFYMAYFLFTPSLSQCILEKFSDIISIFMLLNMMIPCVHVCVQSQMKSERRRFSSLSLGFLSLVFNPGLWFGIFVMQRGDKAVKIASGSSIRIRQNIPHIANFDVRFMKICLTFLIVLFKDTLLIQILSTDI